MKNGFVRAVKSLGVGMMLFGFTRGAALASITQFSSRSLFNTAAGATTNIDFNGIALQDSQNSVASNYSLGGVNFVSNGNLYVVDAGFYKFTNVDKGFLNSDAATDGSGLDTIVAYLPKGVKAVGSDVGSLYGSYENGGYGHGPVIINLSDGTNYTVPGNNGNEGWVFAGFTSDGADIASISFSTNQYLCLDNFVYGPQTAIPEPAFYQMSALLCLSGLGVLRSRRQNNSKVREEGRG